MNAPSTDQSSRFGRARQRKLRRVMLANWLVFAALNVMFVALILIRARFGTDLRLPFDVLLVLFGVGFLVELGAIVAFKHVLWIRKPLVQSRFPSILSACFELVLFAMWSLWIGLGGLFQAEPLSSALALGSAGLAVWLVLAIHIRNFRVSQRGTCESCGYQLVGDDGGRCPECGTGFDRSGHSSPPRGTDISEPPDRPRYPAFSSRTHAPDKNRCFLDRTRGPATLKTADPNPLQRERATSAKPPYS